MTAVLAIAVPVIDVRGIVVREIAVLPIEGRRDAERENVVPVGRAIEVLFSDVAAIKADHPAGLPA
jgi:hypothetical protein